MKYTQILGTSLALALGLFVSASADAHIQLDYPPERNTNSQKRGPCGDTDSTRGDNVTTLTAGETIQVVWHETINHPGHYRIAFDADGQDDFADPATLMEFYSNDAVLVDEIADEASQMYSQDLVVPDVECDNCTLQVIQVMYDKAPPYGDNDLYYRCADIRIVGATGEDMGTTEPDMGTTEPDMGTANNTNNANNTNSVNTNNANSLNSANNASDMGTTSPTGGSDAADDGCSTASGSAAWPTLMIFGLLGLRRRRA